MKSQLLSISHILYSLFRSSEIKTRTTIKICIVRKELYDMRGGVQGRKRRHTMNEMTRFRSATDNLWVSLFFTINVLQFLHSTYQISINITCQSNMKSMDSPQYNNRPKCKRKQHTSIKQNLGQSFPLDIQSRFLSQLFCFSNTPYKNRAWTGTIRRRHFHPWP